MNVLQQSLIIISLITLFLSLEILCFCCCREIYYSYYIFSLFLFKDYLFIIIERGRGWEREGETHPCVRDTSIGYLSHTPNCYLAHNPGMCPDWESNWLAQLVGGSSHIPKGCGFDSWLGYIPRLWVWSLAGPHTGCFCLPSSVSNISKHSLVWNTHKHSSENKPHHSEHHCSIQSSAGFYVFYMYFYLLTFLFLCLLFFSFFFCHHVTKGYRGRGGEH